MQSFTVDSHRHAHQLSSMPACAVLLAVECAAARKESRGLRSSAACSAERRTWSTQIQLRRTQRHICVVLQQIALSKAHRVSAEGRRVGTVTFHAELVQSRQMGACSCIFPP